MPEPFRFTPEERLEMEKELANIICNQLHLRNSKGAEIFSTQAGRGMGRAVFSMLAIPLENMLTVRLNGKTEAQKRKEQS